MTTIDKIDQELAYALEESEVAYWSKYYQVNAPMKSFASVIAGAFAGAIPEQDILSMNRVIGLCIRQPVKPAHIDDIIRFYRLAGTRRFFIQLSPSALPDNLRENLHNKGFCYHNNWVKLWRKANQPLPKVETELTVARIDQQQAPTYGRLIFNSFDWEDQRLVSWLASTVGRPGYHHYLALHQGQPVAAAALHITGQYASMAFAGTLPEYRGRGAQGLLLKTRILDAIEAGCQYIISETAEEKPGRSVASYRNMRRFGFEEAYLRENWIYYVS
ncbi:MAG: GNAT family N-acetyltransferase [Cyclobacteriaceae bacterium]